MTLFDQILTLIAFPFFFVIQCITVGDVFSNHLISGDNLVSNKPIARRSVGLTDALSSSKVILEDGRRGSIKLFGLFGMRVYQK